MEHKIPVAVLGATGAVGQRMIAQLIDHPQFQIKALCASRRSAGKPYGEAAEWQMPIPLPESIAAMRVTTCQPDMTCKIAFSALPKTEAAEVEPAFARSGMAVVSNASSHRMGEDIPLVIPEINPGHITMVTTQRKRRGWPGFIVTNPNCSTIGLALPLKALDDAFGLKAAHVVTLQALSGAGFSGPSALAMGDNVLPYISGEEDKIETEPQKILGTIQGDHFVPAAFKTSATCHRVNVSDGHLETLSVSLHRPPKDADTLAEALSGFRGMVADLALPTSPTHPIVVRPEADRPQPRRDRMEGNGMTVVVGRIRPCPLFDFKMEVLSHNTIRGAAGAAILNAELLVARGLI